MDTIYTCQFECKINDYCFTCKRCKHVCSCKDYNHDRDPRVPQPDIICVHPRCTRRALTCQDVNCELPKFCPMCYSQFNHSELGHHKYKILTNNNFMTAYNDVKTCTYNITDNEFQLQWWVNCSTCKDFAFPGQPVEGRCLYCAKGCIDGGHTYLISYGAFFCDIGYFTTFGLDTKDVKNVLSLNDIYDAYEIKFKYVNIRNQTILFFIDKGLTIPPTYKGTFDLIYSELEKHVKCDEIKQALDTFLSMYDRLIFDYSEINVENDDGSTKYVYKLKDEFLPEETNGDDDELIFDI